MEDLLSRVASIDAQLLALQRDIGRLDPAIQRVDDNVDMTRHSLNNSVQVIANEVGTIRSYMGGLAKDLAPVILMAQEVKEARAQVKGGMTVWTWLSPLLSALVALGAVGIMYARAS